MRLRRSNAGIMESTDMRLLRRLNSNRDFDDPATAIVVDVLLVAVIVAGALFLPGVPPEARSRPSESGAALRCQSRA